MAVQHYRFFVTDEDGRKHVKHGTRPIPDRVPPAPTREDIEAEARAKRGSFLLATDWTQLADAPLSKAQKAAWKDYRQALRDMPAQEGWPFVDWPVPPGA